MSNDRTAICADLHAAAKYSNLLLQRRPRPPPPTSLAPAPFPLPLLPPSSFPSLYHFSPPNFSPPTPSPYFPPSTPPYCLPPSSYPSSPSFTPLITFTRPLTTRRIRAKSLQPISARLSHFRPISARLLLMSQPFKPYQHNSLTNQDPLTPGTATNQKAALSSIRGRNYSNLCMMVACNLRQHKYHSPSSTARGYVYTASACVHNPTLETISSPPYVHQGYNCTPRLHC